MKKFVAEFKEFIMRGNVVELAIGLLVGAQFGTLVDSFMASFITPIIDKIGGGTEEAGWVLSIAGIDFKVGAFLSSVITFLVVMFVAFLIVKGYNAMMTSIQRKKEVAEVAEEVEVNETNVLLEKILKELKK